MHIILQLSFILVVFQCHLSQADTVPLSINFTGPNRFYDLSQFNFKRGLNNVYEYTFTTPEPANSIYLYFYHLPGNMASVEVFDGINDKAQAIGIGLLNSTYYAGDLTYPQAVASTGQSMFVRIRPGQDPKAIKDFQGLATDFTNPDGCDPLVLQVNNPNVTVEKISFAIKKNHSCNHVLHALDFTNNPWMTLSATTPAAANLTTSFYKGLLSIEENRLITVPNVWAFDKHLFFHHSADFSLSASFTFRTNLQRLILDNGGYGMLLTQDYIPYVVDITAQQVQDKFEIDFINDVTHVELIFPQTEFSRSNVTVQVFDGPTSTNITTYTKLPSSLVIQGRSVLLTYQCTQGWGSGLYATYRDVTYQYPSSSTKKPSFEPTTPKGGSSIGLTALTSLIASVMLYLRL